MPKPIDQQITDSVHAEHAREVASLRREIARAREMGRAHEEAARQAQHRFETAIDAGKWSSPLAAKKLSKSKRVTEGTAFLLVSDTHVEEIVLGERVNGLNEYNPDIARRRFGRLAQGAEWMLAQLPGFSINRLVVWLGGDIITGYIHEELEEDNAMAPIPATLFAGELVEGLLDHLLATTQVEELIVVCDVGNHGRTHARRRIKTAVHNSYEWGMYHAIARLYADNPRVKFQICTGQFSYLPVYDWTVRFHHLDTVGYAGGIGGLTIPLRKKCDGWDKGRPAHLTCGGHFHQFIDLQYAIVNGSLIGTTEYGLSIGARHEEPQQAFFVMDSRFGKRLVSPIKVEL